MGSSNRLKTARVHAVQQEGVEKIDNYFKEIYSIKNMPEKISKEDINYLNKIFNEKQLNIEDYRLRGLKCSKLKLSKEERLKAINSIFKGYQQAGQQIEKKTEPIYDEKKSYGRGDHWLSQKTATSN